jgi:hypothetical protein
VTIHEDFAFALPESVSDEAGALMEPLSAGVWACQKAKVSAGDARHGRWLHALLRRPDQGLQRRAGSALV